MLKRIFLCAFIILAGIHVCGAHPHVFITPKVEVALDGYTVKKVKILWFFDKMTSMSMIEYLDADMDGVLSPVETGKIRKEIFPALSAQNYYTNISLDGKKTVKIKPVNFEISINSDSILIYSFESVIDVPVKKTFSVYFEDPEIYTAFDFYRENLKIVGPKGEPVDLPVEEGQRDYATQLIIEF